MLPQIAGRTIAGFALAALAYTPLHAQTTWAPPAPATPLAIQPAPVYPAAASVAPAYTTATHPAVRPRLYALDCGRIHLPDMSMFSDTGEYDGKSGTLVTPCFLILHPSGTLLWDTGLSDTLLGKGPLLVEGGTTLQVDRGLRAQLQSIGVSQIDYLGFSHFHFDHTGNAGAFPNATWLVSRAEQAASLAAPNAFVNPDDIRPGSHVRQQMLDGDHDVFGDGTVRILRAPGHTPGHQVLMVRLAASGPVILSGDLYHTRDNRRYQRVPSFNVNRADTLASMNRIETLARNIGARVIVQHDPEEFAVLPRLPDYLE